MSLEVDPSWAPDEKATWPTGGLQAHKETQLSLDSWTTKTEIINACVLSH